MKINKKTFRKHYQTLSGEEMDAEDVPATYQELFEENSDPEDFDEELAFLLEAAKLSLAENAQLQEYQFETLHAASEGNIAVFLGQVHVRGDAHIDTHTFITGNLQVDGVLYAEEHCILALSGTIKAKGLCLLRSYAYVTGNIEVQQLALLCAYGFLMLGGKLHSPVYIDDQTVSVCSLDEDPHDQEIPDLEKLKSANLLRPENFRHPDFIGQLKALFGPYTPETSDDGTWRFDQSFQLISQGQQLLK